MESDGFLEVVLNNLFYPEKRLLERTFGKLVFCVLLILPIPESMGPLTMSVAVF